MRRTHLLALLALPLVAGTTFAQPAAPGEVDLQATYCIRVVLTQMQFINDSLAAIPQTDPRYAGTEDLLRKRRDDLRRMQQYLAPKMSWLDMEPLTVAAKRAETDLWENAGLASQCFQQCGPDVVNGQPAPEWPACVERCTDTPLTRRLASCRELDWLK